MNLKTREITQVGMFVAFAVAAAMVSRFAPGLVPFSFMPMVAVMGGALLGKRLGALAMIVYTLIGLVGIPVFASPPFGGIAYVAKPTFGFVIGYIGAAYLTGWIIERGEGLVRYITGAALGLVPLYFVGTIYLWASLNLWVGSPVNLWGAIKIGLLPFVLKDFAVAIGAGVIAYGVEKRLPSGVLHRK